MKIIFNKENIPLDKYTLLELDTFDVQGKVLQSYCILSAEEIPLGTLPHLQQWVKMHEDLIHGYKTHQWNYCQDCIANLRGKLGYEMDTFYDILDTRIKEFISNPKLIYTVVKR